MILGRDILTELGLNLKSTKHVIEVDDGPFIGYTAPMVDSGVYAFKIWNKVGNKPEESFTHAYIEEVYKSEHKRTSIKWLRVILDAKNEKTDLHKVMETQYQHLIMTQLNDLLKLFQKFEEFFDGTLGTWKTNPV